MCRAVMSMTGMIGSVSPERYEEIVSEARRLVEQQSRCQFAVGDLALEIEPIRGHGGAHPDEGEELFTVTEALHRFAEDIGEAYTTVKAQRWTASRWPEQRRRDGVSFTVHRILASITDEQERFAAIGDPPVHPRTGRRQWTADAANRRVGRQVSRPESVQEKVVAIHGLGVLITSVVDSRRGLIMAKTSGVVELSRTAPHGGLRVPP